MTSSTAQLRLVSLLHISVILPSLLLGYPCYWCSVGNVNTTEAITIMTLCRCKWACSCAALAQWQEPETLSHIEAHFPEATNARQQDDNTSHKPQSLREATTRGAVTPATYSRPCCSRRPSPVGTSCEGRPRNRLAARAGAAAPVRSQCWASEMDWPPHPWWGACTLQNFALHARQAKHTITTRHRATWNQSLA